MSTLEAAVKANITATRLETKVQRSFFVKKLERHMADKGIKIPRKVFTVMDTPFSEFNPTYREFYENRIKGQALFHVFSDMLIKIYEDLNAEKAGWEDAVEYLEDSPMKLCAIYALRRIDELEQMREDNYVDMVEEFNYLSAEETAPVKRKFNVKPYSGKDKSRWWKKT